ncbi:hypothetical protein PAHAL_2G228700 [Panicum hallii]|uniref:Uncharacterized protein n=1 Tax=Panicum hallii TaxID=206008 RepID=A0A2T8KQ25_9POAL|nr:hypothetical protein PAHAL_2G228700 [Panicum hallii]
MQLLPLRLPPFLRGGLTEPSPPEPVPPAGTKLAPLTSSTESSYCGCRRRHRPPHRCCAGPE